jgi:hypothetical protein
MGMLDKLGRRAKLAVARADVDNRQKAVQRAERRLRRERRLVWTSASLVVVGVVVFGTQLVPVSDTSTFEISSGGLRYVCTADGDLNHVRGQTTTAQQRLDAGSTTTSATACAREAARRAEAQSKQDRRDRRVAVGLALGGFAATWWSRRNLQQAQQVLTQQEARLAQALHTRNRIGTGEP